jgi:hypothetical protein
MLKYYCNCCEHVVHYLTLLITYRHGPRRKHCSSAVV